MLPEELSNFASQIMKEFPMKRLLIIVDLLDNSRSLLFDKLFLTTGFPGLRYTKCKQVSEILNKKSQINSKQETPNKSQMYKFQSANLLVSDKILDLGFIWSFLFRISETCLRLVYQQA